MGGGKNKSSSTVQMTPEQQKALAAQTDALTQTFLPAYQKTLGMANDVYGQVNPVATTAANTALDVGQRAGALQEAGGSQSYVQGIQGLQKLFSPQYKQEQINAAMQPVQENIREQVGGQDALFGGAGSAGSSRYALASRNLDSLSRARLGNVAATVSGNVENQRQAAANSLLGAGQAGLSAAQQSAASRIGYAQTPQDTLSKYAAIIYGTPQASTTPNFSGTQGGTSSSKGFGIQAPKWGG